MDQIITLSRMIEDIAPTCQIDANLALAIAFVESGIDTTKMRYEPDWRYLVNPPKYASLLGITRDTETQLQKFSYSCLQIMGSNARVLGFNGALGLLLQPQLGIQYGCKHLQMLQAKFKTEADIISAYNQGIPAKINGQYKNQLYVQKVTDRLNFLRKGKS
jgi:hypothetical protein